MGKLIKMNLFHFTMWLVIFTVSGKQDISSEITNIRNLETLTLVLNFEEVARTITLRRIPQILANDHLPVWITTDDHRKPFRKLNIRFPLGEFSLYQDPCTKSAFVYFHETNKLNGIIDITYAIKGLDIDESKDVHVVESRHLYRSYIEEWLPKFSQPIRSEKLRSRRVVKLTIYPELLVVINHDTYMAIDQDPVLSREMATVAHVLTVYNAVDMIYSTLSSAYVKLNIAGIVIEGIPNQWKFETIIPSYLSVKYYRNVTIIHQKLSKYFWAHQNHFPRHSYDVILYHTRSLMMDDDGHQVSGNAFGQTLNLYFFPPHYHTNRLSVAVGDLSSYKHFRTIAHELAHILGALHDGEGPHRELFNIKTCGETLMADYATCSKTCLNWSPQAEKEIAQFLRRPAYCNLNNYPRSLDFPFPQKISTAFAQCLCYGHNSPYERMEAIAENACKRPLECISKTSNEKIEVPLPQDGTPCGSDKVCWNGICDEL